MKRFFVAICLLFGLISTSGVLIAQDDDPSLMTLTHNGIERTYHLYLPENYLDNGDTPLVIGLHGAGGTGAQMANNTGLRDLANETGSALVFPNGIDNRWSYLDIPVVDGDDRDDLDFIDTLIEELLQNYALDPSRVSVIGFSNGGLMALRLRCEIDAQLASVAIIGATPTFALTDHCNQGFIAPLPTMVIIGTNDGVFPWEGYAEIDDVGRFYNSFSVAQTMTFLSTLSRCDLLPVGAELTADTSQIRVLVNAFNNCGGVEEFSFEMIALVNFGHTYPFNADVTVDDETMSLEAYMWAFLHRATNAL